MTKNLALEKDQTPPDIYTGRSAVKKSKRSKQRSLKRENSTCSSSSYEDSSTDSSSSYEDDPSAPKSRGWKVLRRHLRKGTLLLTANGLEEGRRNRLLARQALLNELQEGKFSVRFCVMTIAVYLVISIAMYSCIFEPTWTVIDSCYFAVTTFTTLGYGDLYPTNTASVVFTCVYALLGVAFLGMTLGVLGNQLIERHDGLLREVEASNEEKLFTLFGVIPEDPPNPEPSKNSSWWTPFGSTSNDSCLGCFGTLFGGGTWDWRRFLGLCAFTLLLISCNAHAIGWGVISTIYYIIITSCTIGYGDLVPTTQMQRLLAVIYIPLVCLIMGHWLGYFANAMIELQSLKVRKRRLQNRELTQDDLDAMDGNGDGEVTYAEFLEFMLVAMNKIDYELVDELQTYFRQLDNDYTGTLSRENLVGLARRKLKSARRKLELAAYKRRVVNLGKFKRRLLQGRHRRKNLSEVFSTFSGFDNIDDPSNGVTTGARRKIRHQHTKTLTDIVQSPLKSLNIFDRSDDDGGESEHHPFGGSDPQLPIFAAPRREHFAPNEGAAQSHSSIGRGHQHKSTFTDIVQMSLKNLFERPSSWENDSVDESHPLMRSPVPIHGRKSFPQPVSNGQNVLSQRRHNGATSYGGVCVHPNGFDVENQVLSIGNRSSSSWDGLGGPIPESPSLAIKNRAALNRALLPLARQSPILSSDRYSPLMDHATPSPQLSSSFESCMSTPLWRSSVGEYRSRRARRVRSQMKRLETISQGFATTVDGVQTPSLSTLQHYGSGQENT